MSATRTPSATAPIAPPPASRLAASAGGDATAGTYPAMAGVDRVQERRRAAALARHYRDQEGLPVAEIARRLGRAQATVKAYFYDPSDDNKRPRCS